MSDHDIEALLDRAAQTALIRAAVKDLAAEPADALELALGCALQRRGIHAATVLAFALAVAGRPLPAAPLQQILVECDSIAMFTPLVARLEGDRVAFLIELLELGHLSWEREALTAFLAVRLLDGAPPPQRLRTHVRLLARKPLGPEAATLVGVAARMLGDPSVTENAAKQDLPASALTSFAAPFEELLSKDPLATLPECERRVVSGYTHVRLDPKVGRNEPCPCGSGKKFKKCCAGKAPTAPASPLERFERLREGDRHVRRQLFERLRPAEIVRLEPQSLSTDELIQAVRRLTDYHRWADAERFATELTGRTDVPGGAENAYEYEVEIADAAMEAGYTEVAERIVARIPLPMKEHEHFDLQIALARRTPDALDRLHTALTEALAGNDTGRLVGVAHALLDHVPALGILVARGVIDPARLLDSEVLLSAIEEARDELLLPPHEPWWRVLDLLCGDEAVARVHDAAEQERTQLRAETDRLRHDMTAATERARTLEVELHGRIGDMRALSAERERLTDQLAAVRVEEGRARLEALEIERRRLRAKIDELEGHVAAGAAQRAELRQSLARLSAPASRAESRHPSGDAWRRERNPSGAPATEDGEEGEIGDALAAPRFVLIPRFAPAATHALETLPRGVAAQALRTVGNLAAGDALEWQRVKRMRATADLHSARAGRGHRLLFRFGDRSLDIVEIVPRKDLDTVLARR